MKFYYINSQNQKIDFSTYPYLFQDGDLLNYSWEYESNTLKITGFNKPNKEYSISIAVLPDFEIPLKERQILFNGYVNNLLSVFDYDVVNKKCGRLYNDSGSYLECFIISSTKSEWNIGKPFMFNDFTLITNYPFWIKETIHTFKSSEIISTNNKKYGYKYGYRYANGLSNTSIVNKHFAPCNFKLIIYGKCINPTVFIDGHIYKVHTLIEAGERLEIDSKNKTVVKVRNSGYIENLFNSRDKENDIFKLIPTGLSNISWSNDFDFDITLYEERSEPKWI